MSWYSLVILILGFFTFQINLLSICWISMVSLKLSELDFEKNLGTIFILTAAMCPYNDSDNLSQPRHWVITLLINRIKLQDTSCCKFDENLIPKYSMSTCFHNDPVLLYIYICNPWETCIPINMDFCTFILNPDTAENAFKVDDKAVNRYQDITQKKHNIISI